MRVRKGLNVMAKVLVIPAIVAVGLFIARPGQSTGGVASSYAADSKYDLLRTYPAPSPVVTVSALSSLPLRPVSTIVWTPSPVSTPAPADPYVVKGFRETTPMSPSLRARESSLVIRGEVKGIYPARWLTPDGKRPLNPHETMSSIYTPVEIRVTQLLKGKTSQTSILVMAMGGSVGQDRLEVIPSNLSSFSQGDDVVLFLAQEQVTSFDKNTSIYQIFDRYSVNINGEVSSLNDTISLQSLLNSIAEGSR